MSRSAPIRILVVDDFQSYRKFISPGIQQKSEWQVVGEAADGLEGVNRAQELQPDLVLLDIGLPKPNGIEAAKRIRTLAPRSRIVFLSQECSAEVVAEARHLGASGYILKATRTETSWRRWKPSSKASNFFSAAVMDAISTR